VIAASVLNRACGETPGERELSEDDADELLYQRFVAANQAANDFASCGALPRDLPGAAGDPFRWMEVEGLFVLGSDAKFKQAKTTLAALPANMQAAEPDWTNTENACLGKCLAGGDICVGCICFAERTIAGEYVAGMTCIGVQATNCSHLKPYFSPNWRSTVLLRESAYMNPAVNCNLADCLCGNGEINDIGRVVRISPYAQATVPEGCDDGNIVADDGCSRHCTVEAGWTCPAARSACMRGDTCVTNNGGCDANATCSIATGAVTCSCNDGYVGDGQLCLAVGGCWQ
jgi:cysteine-rich repeat protein